MLSLIIGLRGRVIPHADSRRPFAIPQEEVARVPSDYAQDYAAVLIAAIIGLGIVVSAFVLSRLLAPRSPSREKSIPYECGMDPVGQSWPQIHIRYYLFAILFMIFDVETVFLFPWAVTFLGSGPAIFYEMFLFIAILFFGLVLAWRKGALRWK